MTDKAEVWGKRLAACRASGLSTAAFCREQELSYAQYMYWQRRLGNDACGLVPVRVEAAAVSTQGLSVEVALAGIALRVHEATVTDVVALVRGLAC
ncbi:MAG: IS66 family insertion sequence element accessory protein TnpA [Rhodanobacteraceae bacterium]